MNSVLIRELTPENNPADVDTLLPALLSIWNARENHRFLSFTGQPFFEPQVRGWFAGHLSSGIRYFAAMDQIGQIRAIVVVKANRLEGYEILGLGVSPDNKRKGFGNRLVDYSVDVARAEGYRAVDTAVFATNAPMLRLLLGRRFVPVRMAYHLGPAGEDLVHLRCYLEERI